MAYGITNESQMIDMVTINAGCDLIDLAADDFLNAGDIVIEASSICDKNAMSVDGKSMQPGIEELGTAIKEIQISITKLTNEIRSLALQVYSAQSAELQTYRENQRKAAEAANNDNK